ncbi:MAG: O-acetylhomoserine aminocarboxypropyltransferase/cysteine synthase [Clostridiales bacterium]|nr:O-acetylhomoserine aminocarboxypropyltransferase/cysteine synthase [Clostridiales bacterium]
MANLDTIQLHAGQRPDRETHSRAVPIYMTTSYCYDDAAMAAGVFDGSMPGYTYSRIENPTVNTLEERITAIEDGAATVAFASGMAAVTAALYSLCSCGDHIVAISTLYGGTHTLLSARLPQLSNITTTFVGPDDLDAMEKAIRPETRMLYLETICNPNINIPDFDAIRALADKYGLPVVLDNTFGMPPIFRAKGYADIVIHSLSKYAGGHGTSIGGCVVDMGTFDFHNPRFAVMTTPDAQNGNVIYADQKAPVATRLRNQLIREFGACMSPFNAFLTLQGLESLSLRVQRHCDNALKVARFLESHPNVAYVHYPMLEKDPYHDRAEKYLKAGAGAVMSFGVKGGLEAGRRFIDNLKLFSLLANVADAKSLVIHPASTTHGQMTPEELDKAGVPPELIRLSIGLEDAEDLIADLKTALEA